MTQPILFYSGNSLFCGDDILSYDSGVLKVAEVASRINDTAQFTRSLSRLGFKLQNEVYVFPVNN